MSQLAKLAAYKQIEEGTNLAQRNEEYFDHVPGSTGTGSVVGAAGGVVGGGIAGYGLGRTGQRLDGLANNNAKFRLGANTALKNLGFDETDVRDITKKFPKTKNATKIGLGIGLAGGAISGAYKGMMTGVGMNDREYLLQRNIEPHELVDNSAMSALNMGGSSLNPLAPLVNQAFGAQVGAIRRAGFHNDKEGDLIKKHAGVNNMYGLAKIANQQQQAVNRFMEKSEDVLSDVEFGELLNKIKNNYGGNAPHEFTEATNSRFMPQFQLKMLQDKGMFENAENYKDGAVLSNANKHIALHEYGHSLDTKLDSDIMKVQDGQKRIPLAAMGVGATAPTAGVIAADNEKDSKRNALLGAGAAGAVGGVGMYGLGRRIEGTEDRANDFVKRFLTDELGDAAKAEESFKNSPLPHGRETYKIQTKNMARGGVLAGGIGAGLGLGIAGLARQFKDFDEGNQ